MEIKNKEKFLKRLFVYKHLKLIKYETKINDEELNKIINALNIKNGRLRRKYIIEATCKYIDDYYKDCNGCKFENCKCICHRKLNKDIINGCCKKCKHQSSTGCKSMNIACKLFYCTHAELGDKTRLVSRDLPLLKLLNPIERWIVLGDYFKNVDEVIFDLYLWQLLILLLFIVQVVLVILKLLRYY